MNKTTDMKTQSHLPSEPRSNAIPISYSIRSRNPLIGGILATLAIATLHPLKAEVTLSGALGSNTVTVVAWQWGRASESAVQTAQNVERTFQITK